MPEPITAAVPPPSSQTVVSGPTPKVDLVAEYDLPDDTDAEFQAEAESQGAIGVETVPPPPPAPAPPKHTHTHSRVMTRLARRAGFTDEELAETSPDDLKDALLVAQDEARATGAANAAGRASAGGNASTPQPTGPQPPREAEPAPEAFDVGLDEADYGAPLVGALKKMADHFQAKLAALEKGLSGLGQIESRRQMQTAAEQIDAGFGDLGDTFHPLLGKGQRGEVGEAEMERRIAVVNSVQRRPGKGPLRQQIAERAREMFGLGADKVPIVPGGNASTQPARQTPPRDPETGQFVTGDGGAGAGLTEEQWAGAGLARPTQRVAPQEPKGDRRAEKAVNDWKQRNGYTREALQAGREEDDFE
jgi:hypothetical protein